MQNGIAIVQNGKLYEKEMTGGGADSMQKDIFTQVINTLSDTLTAAACKMADMRLASRGISAILAAAMFCTAMVFAPIEVEAAEEYYVRFEDGENATFLLAGERVNVVMNLPEGYTPNSVEPFKITSENHTNDPITFEGTSVIVAKPDQRVGVATYNIQPKFNVFLKGTESGILQAKYKNPTDSDVPLENNFVFSTEVITRPGGDNGVSIINNSTISFSVKENNVGVPVFNPAAATGDLDIKYNGATVGVNKIEGKVMELSIVKEGGNPLNIKITCPSMPENLLADSKFTISFNVETISELQLTIRSKQSAVDLIAKEIENYANFDKYVFLKNNKGRHSITEAFELLHLDRRYNNASGFVIDWEWVPDDGTLARVEISGSPTADRHKGAPSAVLADGPGKLVATVWYKPQNADKVTAATKPEIPITIMGIGIKPSFNPEYSFIGSVDPTTGKWKETETAMGGAMPAGFIMDVNKGMSPGFGSDCPHRFTASLKFGTGVARADHVKIESAKGFSGQVEIYVNNSNDKYEYGTEIKNTSQEKDEFQQKLEIRAVSAGKAQFTIYFYDIKGSLIKDSPIPLTIDIKDTSPNNDATFKSIGLAGTCVDEVKVKDPITGEMVDITQNYIDRFEELFGTDGIIKEPYYTYNPETYTYDILLPWAVSKVKLAPKYASTVSKTGSIVFNGIKTDIDGIDDVSPEYELVEGEAIQIFVNGDAQDGLTHSQYKYNIQRQPRSDVASLTDLNVTTTIDNLKHEVLPAFDSELYDYTLELPYMYRSKNGTDTAAKITATSFGDWGIKPAFSGVTVAPNLLQRITGLFGGNTNSTDIALVYEVLENGTVNNVNKIKITATSEDGKKKVPYNLNIKILDPSRNTQLSDIKVFEKDGETVIPFASGAIFSKKGRDYYVQIPFKSDTAWFELMPDDEKIQKVDIIHPSPYGDKTTEQIYKVKNEPIRFKVDIPYKADSSAQSLNFTYEFNVKAESDQMTNDDGGETYKIHFERQPANKDARLKSLDVVNIADSKALDSYQFIQSKMTYDITVPYTTEEVLVTPVATQPALSEVKVNGTEISQSRLNKNVLLTAGKVNKIEVVITPESGANDKVVYTLNIKRESPASEARLQKLVVGGGEKMLPEPFVPAVLNYTVQIPEGTAQYTVTATPVDPNATVTINGKAVPKGQASAPIIPTEAQSTVEVVVTAQDGKTTKKYTIRVTDYNLVKKSNNADLADVKLYYADITPEFKSGTDAYEVYLKPQATSFEITPVKANANATMVVTVGSKELKAYGGKYNTSLFGKKTAVAVKVTSEDGKVERTYTFDVYKDTKEKEGSFKPITAEMVDFTAADPIVIDISNYAIVDATVFNTLKTEFPDKTIIFSGNDYMLRIKGSDIKELVPHTTQFDLFFSFETPDQATIDSMLMSSETAADWATKPVYLHFNDHGSLPGQMLLTVSLGGKYKNSTLFWNYFNPERKRIDYYGYVQSNAKGTITVPLAHMSTYLVTTRKLAFSEDKTGTGFGAFENGEHSGGTNGNISGGVSPDKEVPKTGAAACSEELS